jgi:anti-anti-sigma factor
VDLDIKENGSICTLKPKGRLFCGESLDQFENAYTNALASGHVFLIFDLESVPYLDSSAIGSLVNALRKTSKVGGSVKLVKPANFVSKTLKMVGLLDLFEVFDNEADAAAACVGS